MRKVFFKFCVLLRKSELQQTKYSTFKVQYSLFRSIKMVIFRMQILIIVTLRGQGVFRFWGSFAFFFALNLYEDFDAEHAKTCQEIRNLLQFLENISSCFGYFAFSSSYYFFFQFFRLNPVFSLTLGRAALSFFCMCSIFIKATLF